MLVLALAMAAGQALEAGAATRYKKLSAVGVKADRAAIQGRVVQVRIRAKRRVQIRLAVVRKGKVQQAWAKTTVKKGTRTITRRLNRTPASFTNLKLRVTATRGKTKARGLLNLKVLPVTPPPPPNGPPTAIGLSASSVAENRPAGTAVGTLSATDPNPADTLSFALVAGAGSTDNASFAIAGTALRTAVVLDAEAKPALSIRVRVSDGKGGTFERQLTITVTNAGEPPTDIALSSSSVAENLPAATTVGLLSAADPDPLDTQTFTLVTGTGDTDNASFAIAGTMLQTAAAFDFEAKASYSIRVRTTDAGGATFEKALTVGVTNVNEIPTDVALSSTSIVEGPSARTVGTFSTTDPDAGDTFTYALVGGAGSTDNASFAITGNTLQTSAAFTFPTPAKSIRVRVTDAGGLGYDEVFSITITRINAAPTDIALSNTSVAENATVNTVVGTLSATDADAGETFTFSLVAGAGSTDNASFNIAGSSLRTSAVFNVEAKSSYAIRLRVTDSQGGTFEEQFTVTVTNVNEAPTDIALSNASVAENTAAGTAVGTLSSSDEDAGATHTYTLVAGTGSTDNAKFQIVGTALQRSAAALDFETTPTASVRVRTTDNNGLFFEEALTITVTDANDAPVADDEAFNGVQRAIGNTAFVGNDPSDGAPDPAGPQKTITGDILAGDADQDGTGSLAVTAETKATNDGGTVTLEADGDFTLRPAAGTSCTDHSDFFDYTVTDQNTTRPPGTPATDVGRVTIEIQDCVWYVDGSAAAGGNGTSGTPFNALSAVNGAGGAGDADAASHTLFLYDGSYAGGLPLEASQTLYGQRHGLTVPDGGAGSVTLEPAVPSPGGAASTIAGGLALSTNNTIQGIDLGNAAGAALSGTTIGTAVMNTVTPGQIDNQTGQAVGLGLGTVDMAFSSISSNGSPGSAIGFATVAGTFTAAAGTLTNATGAVVAMSGGTVDFTYGGTITDDLGQLVSIANQNGGTKDFNGAITDGGDGDGSGIALTSNTGATIRFDGGLTLATGANPAFAATGGGTLAVTDPAGAANNTVVTTTGTALNVANTTIAAGGLTFERISSAGAARGIVLDDTGATAGLAVTGAGGTCTAASTAGCTGGQIANATGADDPGTLPVGTGVVLRNTTAPAFTRVWIHDHSNYAIRGTNVVGLTMADSVINGSNGTSALTANKDGSLRFEELTGTVNMTNTAISGGFFTNLMVDNTAGVLTATLDNVDSGAIDATGGDDAVQFEGIGTSDMNVDYRNSAFTTASGDLFQYIGDGSGGGDLVVVGNTFTNNEPSINTGGGGVALVAGAKGAATMDVTGNTLRDSLTNALTVIKSRDATAGTNNLVANIASNTIGVAGTANSGSVEGDGIEVTTFGDGNATFNVTNNTVRQYNSSAMQFVAGSGVADGGQFNLNIAGNSAANPGTNPSITLLQGVRVDSGVDPGDTFATCVNFGANSITGSSDAANKDFRLVASQSTTIRQPGYAGGATDGGAFAAFAAGRIGSGAQGTAAANAPATFSGTGTTCP